MLPGAVLAEVQSWRDRHTGLFKQIPTELIAVGSEPFTIRIDIEGAFRGNRYIKAEAPQVRQQEIALCPKCIAPLLQKRNGVGMKRSNRSLLCQVRGRDEQILREFVDRSNVLLRHNHPS